MAATLIVLGLHMCKYFGVYSVNTANKCSTARSACGSQCKSECCKNYILDNVHWESLMLICAKGLCSCSAGYGPHPMCCTSKEREWLNISLLVFKKIVGLTWKRAYRLRCNNSWLTVFLWLVKRGTVFLLFWGEKLKFWGVCQLKYSTAKSD